MSAATSKGARVQVFCVLMLDGQIETKPGSGEYSEVIEGKAFRVN